MAQLLQSHKLFTRCQSSARSVRETNRLFQRYRILFVVLARPVEFVSGSFLRADLAYTGNRSLHFRGSVCFGSNVGYVSAWVLITCGMDAASFLEER